MSIDENTIHLKKFWFDVLIRHDYRNPAQLEKINSYRRASFDYFRKYLENYPYELKNFLDVGCFDTFNMKEAENIWLDAYWIDLYPMEESEKIYKEDFYKMSEKLPKFDVVFCNHTLEHADSVYSLMEQIANLQEKNWLLFIAVPDGEAERSYSLYQSTTHYSVLTYGFLLTTMQRFWYNVIPHEVELREWCPELRFIWIKN